MAKREKVDISDIFLDGAMNAQEKAEVMLSPLWSIAVAAYSTTERKLRVAGYKPEVIYFTNEHGLNVMAAALRGATYKLEKPHDPISVNKFDGSLDSYGVILQTNNPRYIVNVLRKTSTHRVKEQLISSLFSADTQVSRSIRSALNLAAEKINGDSRFHFEHMEMDGELQSYVAEIVASGASWEYVKPEIRTKFDSAYKKYADNKKNFDRVLDRIWDMFSTDKWLYVPMNGGLILGVVSHHATQALVDQVRRDKSTSSFHADMNLMPEHPPKWYRTYEDVPEDIRRDFEMACLMFKTHAGYDGGIVPPQQIGEDVSTAKLWEPVGATCRKFYNEEPVYLITKV
jgi:hypothetical protein